MAIPTINFKGFLYDDAGDAISGATINLYDKNTSTTSRASTTTDSNGAWSIDHTTAGEFDVQITSGSSKRRIKFDDKIHLSEVDTETLNIRGNEGAAAPMYWFADDGDDAGDRWLFNAAAGGVFTMGNDLNSQGTYVAHVTITPNATVANSTFAVAGNLTVGNALTVTGTTTLNGNLVLGDAAADTLTVGATLQGASPLTFEGGTADGYETTFAITDPTADRTITFPNLTGTVQLSGNPISGTTIDASTDFTIGDTVITDGVVTDSTGLQLAANLDINGTVDISGDLTLSAGGDGALVFATAGENSIKIPDNQGSALIIEEANNAYMTFVTTDSSEAVSIAKTLTLSTVAAAGTDTDKFLVLDSSGNVDYRTGTQVLSDIGGGTGGGDMTSFQLEDGDGTEVTISDAKEVKFIDGDGIDINWTDTDNGTDADPYDLTFTLDIDGMTDIGAALASGDLFIVDDGAGGTNRKTTIDRIATLLAGTGLSDSSAVISVDTSQAITALTGGDLTIYEDANNADVSLKMGTSATESLTIQVLNGGSNKTAEAVHFSTATASGTADHGQMVFDVDGTDILTIDDGGLVVTGEVAAATLDLSGAADIAGDLTLSAGADGALRFSVASSIKILDNSATSLVIEEADKAYMTFDSTDTKENISLDVPVHIDSSPADETVSGITATFTAGETLVRGEVVYFKQADSKMWKAVATAAATSNCVAMAAEDITGDAAGKFLLQGFCTDNGTFPDYSASSGVGKVVYTPEAETSSQNVPEKTAPDTDGDFVQIIGYVVSANTLYFNPNSTIVEVS